MFSQLGVAISASLLASLLLAGTLAPLMAARLATARAIEKESRIHHGYRRLLSSALRHPRLVMLACAFLFGATILLILPRLGIEFLPVPDDGMIGSPFRLPTGMSLDESNQVIRPLAAYLGSDSRVLSCFHRVGFPAGAEEAGAVIGLSDHNEGEFFLRLKPKSQRDVSTKDFIEEIRAVTRRIPGLEINLRQSGEQLFNADRAAITIQVFGPDLPTLKTQLERVRESIRTVSGIRDLDFDLQGGRPELQIHIDRHKAMQAGLSLPDIAFALRTAVQGRRVSLFRQDGDEMYIRLRGPLQLEHDPEAVLDIPLEGAPATRSEHTASEGNNTRGVATLRSFAHLESGSGEEKLYRERQMRRGMVFANYAGRSLGEVVADIQQRLADLELPEGYFLHIGGMYEDTVEAGRQLLYVFVLGVILVYMIMASQFESFKDPFVVFFSVPLAAIGMLLGLYVFRQTINISSALGLVILLGIAVNNAIVLIDFIRQLRLQGVSLEQALVDGPTARLRPVAMTTLTTVLGLLPLGFGYGDGAELQQPLAISLICGLSFSTLLTLFV
ncbi:MAG TPA: efflux RND transporter permease subunit, partial [Candidatus Ozemobacteraceae bacterium]|nr:efflux RND transporter permease subunit [Candidatus Ozemobacteraceae bacterium]